MNPIESLYRIQFYTDLTRNARYSFSEYAVATNDVIQEYIDEMLGDVEGRIPSNFQWVQSIRDNLYTLIKTATPAITNGTVITNEYYSVTPSTIPFPADYYDFITLMVLIDGYTKYSRPTSYNEQGPLFEDSFKYPRNNRTYYNENSTGLTIFRGVGGTFTTATLTYIRATVSFSIGQEANLINAGGVLALSVTYYAMEVSVYNATTYQVGTIITGTGAALTSGQVIPTSVTSPIDLPDKVHEEICKRAAARLLGVVQITDQSMFIQKEATRPD